MSTRVALVSESRNANKRKAVPSPTPSATVDPAEARNELKEQWQAKEEQLKLEKAQIENGVKNSTGAVREQWKYRMAVLQAKMADAKKDKTATEAAVK